MIKTTLLMALLFVTALVLSAQGKLTTEEKLQLSRLEAAAAKAQATLTNFVSQAQRAVQEMEQKAKESREAHERFVSSIKEKHGINPACVLDENQDPKLPVNEKQADGSSKTVYAACPPKEVKK